MDATPLTTLSPSIPDSACGRLRPREEAGEGVGSVRRPFSARRRYAPIALADGDNTAAAMRCYRVLT